MILNRLIAMMLAVVLTMSCIPRSWAGDAQPAKSEPDGGSVAAAVVSNLIYIPGKVVTCILGGALWTAAMTVTAGTCYKQCGSFVHGACAGKWVIRGEDMASPEKEF